MREIEVAFNVSGGCTQTIKLNDDCPLSEEEIIDGLNGHGLTICTTLQKGGDLVHIKPSGEWAVIGKVTDSNVDAEYTDFENPFNYQH